MSAKTSQSPPQPQRLLPRFRRLCIGVLGDVMLDRYVWGDATRLSPEAAVPVVSYVSQQDCAGGAGNVAMNLAALGARVVAFGAVGGETNSPSPGRAGKAKRFAPDEAGAALHACLRKAGIAVGGVLADPHRVTTMKTRIIARHQQIVRIDRERRDPLAPETQERLFRLLVAALNKLDGLVVSDYDKGLLGDEFTDRVLHAAHRLNVPVFVKPKSSRRRPYNGARAVVCNAKEAADYVGHALPDENAVIEAGRALLSHFGAAAVVITRGGQGMTIFEEVSPRHLHIPATSFEVTYARIGQPGIERGATGRQVFDVTGAGDTVLSVLALALAAGAPLPEAARLANAAAGVVVGKLGTAAVTPKELSAALQELHA
jgi:D-beta-D-heptose 7-phosphate kinase/D-beta-D-heptose 1-phosphate adenosyltransferase